ncbi:MAG: D-amino-acid transaminase [Methylocystaceae bacterium]|nr:D-amino-acid transaminase [Methylocystaceae bacterium]
MSRFAYVNGTYARHEEASVHIEDRGFQFADGIYEVIYLYKGRLIDTEAHLDRMERSLREIHMDMPMSRRAMMPIIKELIRRNRLRTGLIYMQVTRGSSKRDFIFPEDTVPTLVITARRGAAFDPNKSLQGMKVMTMEDMRWARCDIKTTALLPASMCKQVALDAGYSDAWLVNKEGFVTEGTSNNAWIVNAEGKLQTRPPSHEILNGITRKSIIELAQKEGIEIVEKPFTVEEAYNAREAFVTSASACVKPVTQIDDKVIANGAVGLTCEKIAKIYADFLEKA